MQPLQPYTSIPRVKPTVAPRRAPAVETAQVRVAPAFQGVHVPFRLSDKTNIQLTNFLYPRRAWLPFVLVPPELRPHTESTWASRPHFLAGANRHFSNIVHQGLVSLMWGHVFDGFQSVAFTHDNRFHPLFEYHLMDTLGILNRVDPEMTPEKVRISSKHQQIPQINASASPGLRRLMNAIHDDYRAYLSRHPEQNRSFQMRVVNNEIVADHIHPSLWL